MAAGQKKGEERGGEEAEVNQGRTRGDEEPLNRYSRDTIITTTTITTTTIIRVIILLGDTYLVVFFLPSTKIWARSGAER